MPHAPQRQLWDGDKAEASTSDDSGFDEYESSDLSEMDDGSEFTPDTEDEAMTEETHITYENYEFKLRESVWVKPRGCFDWFPGTIVKVREPIKNMKVPHKHGKLYRVVFRRHFTNMRDVFSSVEGNIMPDTPRVRALINKPRHEAPESEKTRPHVSRSSSSRSRRRRSGHRRQREERDVEIGERRQMMD